jgi:DNA-binding NarL/FixJ family response regulator
MASYERGLNSRGNSGSVKPFSILIADDHAVVRRGLCKILRSQPGIAVCWEASNGLEALDQASKAKPDLAILDLTMPVMDGIESTRRIREASPETEVLILTMHLTEEFARTALAAGARGYVLKSDADEQLVEAVQFMREHKPYFTGELQRSMAQLFSSGPHEESRNDERGRERADSLLTSREVEIVRLLAAGRSNKEVASALGISTRTVESHRNRVMRKMGFTSFSALVRFAVRSNLVDA